MIKHPHSRAERLRLKYLKDSLDKKSEDRASRRIQREALKAKEIEDELRQQVLGSEAKATVSANTL